MVDNGASGPEWPSATRLGRSPRLSRLLRLPWSRSYGSSSRGIGSRGGGG